MVVRIGLKQGCGSVPLRGWGNRFPGMDNAVSTISVVRLSIVGNDDDDDDDDDGDDVDRQ
jgi:hypothetical protein